MKNLYILPTNKPSRLRYTHGNNYALSKEHLSWRFAHHIYITSDDDILVGDWHLKTTNNSVGDYILNSINPNKGRYKKIILTTDPDIIADGVQAIDNEFLEWFVKNPSCKFVQIHYIKDDVYVAGFLATSTLIKYEIIIPKVNWEELENSGLDTPLVTWDFSSDINLLKKILYKSNLEHCGSAEDMQDALEEINDLIKKHHPNLEEDSE